MKAVAKEAEEAGCGMIKWWVAKWNERGIEFYKRLGANNRQRLARISIVGKSVSRFGCIRLAAHSSA